MAFYSQGQIESKIFQYVQNGGRGTRNFPFKFGQFGNDGKIYIMEGKLSPTAFFYVDLPIKRFRQNMAKFHESEFQNFSSPIHSKFPVECD